MFNKSFLVSLLAVISMISAESLARDRGEGHEPNPPRYGGDNPSPGRGGGRGEERPGPRPGPSNGGGGGGPRDPGPRPNPGPRDPGPRPGPRPEPRPEPRPNPGPRPGPGPRPEPPPRPMPPPYNPPPEYGDVRREIYLNRSFGNESLNLRRLAGLGYEYQNYSIAAVEVQLNSSRYANADLQLRLNGMVEDTERANDSYVVLRPYSNNMLGSNLDSLMLDIRGVAYVRMVTVVLNNRAGYYPDPRMEEVNLTLYRSVGSYDRIDLSQYVDLRRYSGWVLDSIVINARAIGRAALIDVVVQGSNQTTLNVEPYDRSYVVGLYGRNVIDSWTTIELLTRGQMNIDTVTLRLVRR